MNNRNTRPLKERAEEIKQWLAGRLEKIREARKNRAAGFAEHEDVRRKVAAGIEQIDELIVGSYETISRYEEQIETCRECIEGVNAEIAELRDQRKMSKSVLAALDYEQTRLRRRWAQAMRLFQDGKVRRKRRDLAKLERRIEAKRRYTEEAAALPRVTTEEIAMGITPEMKAKEQEDGKPPVGTTTP